MTYVPRRSRALSLALTDSEAKLKARLESTVRHLTPEEIEAYAAELKARDTKGIRAPMPPGVWRRRQR